MSATGSPINVDSGPAEVQAAEELEDGNPQAFQKLVAHSQYRMAVQRGDKQAAKQAARVLKDFKGNAQLREDEWKRIDDTLTAVARDNTLGLQTLRDEGLDVPLDLGVLRFEWEDVDDFGDAEVDMSGTAGDDEDALSFTNNGIPLPIVHKSFKINMRKLRASRRRGQPLDTAGVDAATAAVSRKLEDILYGGNSITVQGDSVSGFTDFVDRQTVSGNATWDGSTPDNMIDDVMRTIESLEDAKALPGRTGYRMLIARQNYQEARAKNSGTDDKKGVLEHLRERMQTEDDVPEVEFLPVDRLAEGNAVLVKPTERYVQLPMPADIQTVQWESNGGWTRHFKVVGSVMPALRSDTAGNSGVAHLSGI
jgi:uncharacterized linocin/CFP29 family protein